MGFHGLINQKDMLIVIFGGLRISQNYLSRKTIENLGPIQIANSLPCKPAILSGTSVGNHLHQDQPQPIIAHVCVPLNLFHFFWGR